MNEKYNPRIVFKLAVITLFIGLIVNLPTLRAQEISQITDLPLQLSVSRGSLDVLAVYITGDGGWNNFNQQIVQLLVKQGYGVVALNSRKYFWNEKSPEIFAHDAEHLAQ